MLFGVFSFDDSAVVDITDGNRKSKFEGRGFTFVSRVFGIALVNAGHLLNCAEDIFSVALVFLSLLIIAQGVVCCM